MPSKEFLERFENKLQASIERYKTFEPEDGYYICFSGGKDSQCIYHLAKQAGVKFDAHYNVTSVDPPELVRFIKSNYPDVTFEFPRYPDGTHTTMWNLIPKMMMPPLRMSRYCCRYLKETSGGGGWLSPEFVGQKVQDAKKNKTRLKS